MRNKLILNKLIKLFILKPVNEYIPIFLITKGLLWDTLQNRLIQRL